MKRLLCFSFASAIQVSTFAGCGSDTPAAQTPENPPVASETPKAAEAMAPPTPVATTPAPPAPEPPKKEEPKAPAPVFVLKDAGFATPESVLYDATDDVYLVSNINGGPNAVDNNGFISRVSPEGKVVELKWIEGGKKGVKLDAPKGLAIVGDSLFVADITQVREFDRKTGKPKGDVKLPGATFVNDVSAFGGKLYATDTGIRIDEKGVTPTKSDAVWVIEKGKAKSLAKGEDLGRPNGVVATDKGVWVATFGSGEIYRLDDKGAKQDVQKLPKGSLDGLVMLPDGVLVSSWDGSAVFRSKNGGTFDMVFADVKAPADIGFDAKRSRIIIPLFNDNGIVVYDVK